MRKFLLISILGALLLCSGCSEEEEVVENTEQTVFDELSTEISTFNVFVSNNKAEIAAIAEGKNSKFIVQDERYTDVDEVIDWGEVLPKSYTLQDGYVTSYDWKEGTFNLHGICKSEDLETFCVCVTFVKNEDGTYGAVNRAEGLHDKPVPLGDVEETPELEDSFISDADNIDNYDDIFEFDDDITTPDNDFTFDDDVGNTDHNYDFGDDVVDNNSSDGDYEFDTTTSGADHNYEFNTSGTTETPSYEFEEAE